MIVKDYKVTEKKLKQMKRSFYYFAIGAVLSALITVYRYIKGEDIKWFLITVVIAVFFAFVYYMWPKRAHFTIDENNIVDYCDGFVRHYRFDITKVYNFSYKKETQRLLGMDQHYYRMVMPFMFGEENFDDFVKHIYYLKVKAVDAGAADRKYREEKAQQEEEERREKLRKKKKKEKEKARKLAEKEARKAEKEAAKNKTEE